MAAGLGAFTVRHAGQSFRCRAPRGKRRRLTCKNLSTSTVSGTRRKRGKARRAGVSRKDCLKANGRLRKGYRFGKGGRCIKAKRSR